MVFSSNAMVFCSALFSQVALLSTSMNPMDPIEHSPPGCKNCRRIEFDFQLELEVGLFPTGSPVEVHGSRSRRTATL